MPHQRLTCSGFVIASNTSSLGASNSRVSRISRSEGVIDWNVPLFAAVPAIMFVLLCLKLVQIRIQPIEALLPDVAIALRPVDHVLQRCRPDPAGAPLG